MDHSIDPVARVSLLRRRRYAALVGASALLLVGLANRSAGGPFGSGGSRFGGGGGGKRRHRHHHRDGWSSRAAGGGGGGGGAGRHRHGDDDGGGSSDDLDGLLKAVREGEENFRYAPASDRMKKRGGVGGEEGPGERGRRGWTAAGRERTPRAGTKHRGYKRGGGHGGHRRDGGGHGGSSSDDMPFPVYDYAEADEIPGVDIAPAAAASAPAYDALECRSSVIDFVINATDVKDECEGLRKAFDKTCSAHVMQQQQQQQEEGAGGAPSPGGESGVGGGMQRRRRLLQAYGANYADDDGRADVGDGASAADATEAYEGEGLLGRVGRRARRLWRLVRPRRPDADAFLFAEDEVAGEAWDEASYQVRHNYDRSEEYARLARKLEIPAKRRSAEEGGAAIADGARRAPAGAGSDRAAPVHVASAAPGATTTNATRARRDLAKRRDGADAGAGSEEREYAPVGGRKRKEKAGPRKKDALARENFVDISEDRRDPAEGGEGEGEGGDGDAGDGEAAAAERTSADSGAAASGHVMLSPKLPTSSEHVDGQMLNDAVLLAEGGTNEEIASAVRVATNGTAAGNGTADAAVADAKRSASAVSKATAAVSAVLNDPDSVEARTCCASILNVFHEHCDHPEVEDLSDRRLFLIVFVIAFCGMVKSLIRHFQIRWLPEAAGCILVGVLAWFIMQFVPHFDFGFDGNMFLRVLVPPIVFEAALSIDKKSFQRHVIPIMLFAIAGTLVSTFLTAFIVSRGSAFLNAVSSLCPRIPFVESLLFGALISSIDPIAVLSVLSNMGMTDTDTIYVLIFGESLLNDGVAIVLFQTLVHFLDESLLIDGAAVGAAAVHFLVVALGSLAVGVASGACCTAYYFAMRGVQTPLVEVLMFICWAFIPYYICDGVGWSGIVSVVAAGIVMDLYVVGQKPDGDGDGAGGPDRDELGSFLNGSAGSGGGGGGGAVQPNGGRSAWGRIFSKEGHLSEKSKSHIHFVTQINATLMETAIFAYLGLFLFSARYHWNFWLSAIAIFSCVSSRALMIPAFSHLSNWLSRTYGAGRGGGVWSLSKLSRSWHDGEPSSSSSSSSSPPPPPEQQPTNRLIIDHRMQIVLWFAGLRGAMSFALVENIPLYDTVTKQGSRLKPELKAMTSATIVFTVFVLGGTTYYLMEWLGMSLGGGREPDMIEMGTPLVRKSSEVGGGDDDSRGGRGDRR